MTKNTPKFRRKQKKIHKEALSIHHDNLNSEQRESARMQLFIKQDGCCAICGTPEKDLKKKLSLDHCHATGHIRGLLCFRCNTFIGFAKDNVYILQGAMNYLIENREKWTGIANKGCVEAGV